MVLVVVADLFIVMASFMEYIQFAVQSLSTLNPKILRVLRVFRAVRAVRALRVLRTISFLKNLQVRFSLLSPCRASGLRLHS